MGEEGGRPPWGGLESREWFQAEIEDLDRLVLSPQGKRALLAKDAERCNFAHYTVDSALWGDGGARDVTWQTKTITFLADNGAAQVLVAENSAGKSPAMHAVVSGQKEVFECMLQIAFNPTPPPMSVRMLTVLRDTLTGGDIMKFVVQRERTEYLRAILELGGAECLRKGSIPHRGTNINWTPAEFMVREDAAECVRVLVEVAGTKVLLEKAFSELFELKGGQHLTLTGVAIVWGRTRTLQTLYEHGWIGTPLQGTDESPGFFAILHGDDTAIAVILEHEKQWGSDKMKLPLKVGESKPKCGVAGVASMLTGQGKLLCLQVFFQQFGKNAMGFDDERDPFAAAILNDRFAVLDYLYTVRKRKCPKCRGSTKTVLQYALETHRDAAEWRNLASLMRIIHKHEGDEFAREYDDFSPLHEACRHNIPKAIFLMHELAGDAAFASSLNLTLLPFETAELRGHDECLEALRQLNWLGKGTAVGAVGTAVGAVKDRIEIVESREWFRTKILDLSALVEEGGKGKLLAKDDEGCTFAHYAVNGKLLGTGKKETDWQIEKLEFLVEHGGAELLIAETKSGDTPAALSGLDDVFVWMLNLAYCEPPHVRVDVAAKLRAILTGCKMLGRVCIEGRFECLRAMGQHGTSSCLDQWIDVPRDVDLPSFVQSRSLTPVMYACMVDGREKILNIVHEFGGKEALSVRLRVTHPSLGDRPTCELSLTGLSILSNRDAALRMLYCIGCIEAPQDNKELTHVFLFTLLCCPASLRCLDVVCEFEGKNRVYSDIIATRRVANIDIRDRRLSQRVMFVICSQNTSVWDVLRKHFGDSPFCTQLRLISLANGLCDVVRFLYTLWKAPLKLERDVSALYAACTSCTYFKIGHNWNALEQIVRVIYEAEGSDFCRVTSTNLLSGLHCAVREDNPELIYLLHELAGDLPYKVSRGSDSAIGRPERYAQKNNLDECLEALRQLNWLGKGTAVGAVGTAVGAVKDRIEIVESREWFRTKILDLSALVEEGGKGKLLAKDDEGCTFAHYAVNGKLLGTGKKETDWQIEKLEFLVEHGGAELLIAETKSGDTPAALSGLDDVFVWMLDLAYTESPHVRDDVAAQLCRVLTCADIVLRAIRKGCPGCLRAIGRRGGASCLNQDLDLSEVTGRPTRLSPAVYACAETDDKRGCLAVLHEFGGREALKGGLWAAIKKGKLRAVRNLYSIGASTDPEIERLPSSTIMFAVGEASADTFAVICECEGKDRVLAERYNAITDESGEFVFKVSLASWLAATGEVDKLRVLIDLFGKAVLRAEGKNDPVYMAVSERKVDVLRLLYTVRQRPLKVAEGGYTALTLVLGRPPEWEKLEAFIRLIYEFEGESFCRQDGGVPGKRNPLSGLQIACLVQNEPRVIHLMYELAKDLPFSSVSYTKKYAPEAIARDRGHDEVVKALVELGWTDAKISEKKEANQDQEAQEKSGEGKIADAGTPVSGATSGGDKLSLTEELQLAVEKKDEQGFKSLWTKRVRPSCDDAKVVDLCIGYVTKGQEWCLRVILTAEERDPSLILRPSLDLPRYTPINLVELAAHCGQSEVFEPIFRRWGAESLGREFSRPHWTPAHWAASQGHVPVLKEIARLVGKEQAVSFFRAKTCAGETPAALATSKGRSAVVTYLSEMGCLKSEAKQGKNVLVEKPAQMEKRLRREALQKALEDRQKEKQKEEAKKEVDEDEGGRIRKEEEARKAAEELVAAEEEQKEKEKKIAEQIQEQKRRKEEEARRQQEEEKKKRRKEEEEEEERQRKQKEREDKRRKKQEKEDQRRRRAQQEEEEEARRQVLREEEEQNRKEEEQKRKEGALEVERLKAEEMAKQREEKRKRQADKQKKKAKAAEDKDRDEGTPQSPNTPCSTEADGGALQPIALGMQWDAEVIRTPGVQGEVTPGGGYVVSLGAGGVGVVEEVDPVAVFSELLLGEDDAATCESRQVTQQAGKGGINSVDARLRLRPSQQYGSVEFNEMWGWTPAHPTPPPSSSSSPHDPATAALYGKGLHNPAGTNNCFLNVIIQALWHMETFRQSLALAVQQQDLVMGGSDETQRTELLLSLIETFENLSERGGVGAHPPSHRAWGAGPRMGANVVDPERCRNALGAIFEVHGRGQVTEMGDAAEALHDIFDTLHACFVQGEGHAHPGVGAGETPQKSRRRGVNRKEKEKNKAAKKEGAEGEEREGGGEGGEERGGGFWSPSVVSDTFGFHVTETTECMACKFQYPSHKYTRFFQMVPFEAWRDAWRRSSVECEPEELLKATYSRESRTCQKCSKDVEVEFEVHHVSDGKRAPPKCMALLVQWQSGTVSSDDISLLLSLLPLTMDLALVNENVLPGTYYRLRCMICLYGAHFIAIAFNPKVSQWVQYDDSKVTALGGWDEVVEKLKKGRFQPEVCFYERVSSGR